MKAKKKIYANILCNAAGSPYKMIVTDGQHTSTIQVSNSSLKLCKKAAKDIYGATEIFVSLVQDT